MSKRVCLSLSNDDSNPIIIKEMDDEMETIIRCPYCGEITTVGRTIMVSGFVGCDRCYWEEDGLLKTVLDLRENNYDEYLKGDFYRQGNKGAKKGA